MRLIQINFSIANDKTIKKLNREWFGKTTTTDVISFSMQDNHMVSPIDEAAGEQIPDPVDDVPRLIGEIIIGEDEVRRNAKKYGVTFEQELARVAAHGVLHLYGYTDDTEEARLAMKAIEDIVVTEFDQSSLTE